MTLDWKKQMVVEGVENAFSQIKEELAEQRFLLEEELFYYVVKLFCLTPMSKIKDESILTVKITSVDTPNWKGVRTLESGNFKQLKDAKCIAEVKLAMRNLAEIFNEELTSDFEAKYEQDANNGAGVLTVRIITD